ncbi:methyl-accepting chemotaxis protein [Ensifer soli]|uniref:methyl-accepting chemotaxis protein n=1 Tax=Ciceribacter sp. sgz301302 TaxID=3342379 RepID=UPI0035B83FBD
MLLSAFRKTDFSREAIGALTANVMIADAKLNIVYMNDAVRSLLNEAEADLKKELPRFDVASLIGANIDIFHKNPAHQRGMLKALRTRHRATIQVGARAFDLVVTPLKSGETVTGFVVEWANAADRLQNVDYRNQMQAISRAQAIVEFTPDGTIRSANERFLQATGYRLEEIRGQHHRIFVEPAEASAPAYASFWASLGAGAFQAGEYRRIGKGGRLVILNASYNPILDERGHVAKIVKFATDVSERVRAVDRIGEGLTRLAAGALDFTLTEPLAGDFEPLRANFNNAVMQLRETLTAVAEATSEIDGGTQDISRSASDLSRRTEQQAAALEETAAALDEITVNVASSTKRTEDARRVATTANENATKSAAIVGEAEAAMSRIEASSQQISNIIGVIDEIAFQTNLLALNAGVEAARAGDAGKGFAVVAQEVRELAQRSAQAAKEIKSLIQNSTSQVEGGVRLVREAGQALKRIGEDIGEMNAHMAAIATSAREQSTGLAEVNSAVNEMDQVTQQNAAMVEEANAAGATLAGETARLRERIGHFSLGAGALRHAAPVRIARGSEHGVASPARLLQQRAARAVAPAAAEAHQWDEF